MIVIEVRFLVGRFHATPWGRNVNEGVVEWPPSTFRLARAIIDTWQRRFPEWSSERIYRILMLLSGVPYFHLPTATSSHIRVFLSSNQKNPFKKEKIFDAFVVTDPNQPLYIGFKTTLSEADYASLDLLLRHINYFGRSESWVSMRLISDLQDIIWNCKPVWANKNYIGQSEIVQVACLQTLKDYDALPIRPLRRKWQAKLLGKGECDWFDAIFLTSADLLNDGWSNHPALSWVDYARSADALSGYPARQSQKRPEVRYVKYALHSSVLPLVEETISISERVRAHLMGINNKIVGGDPTLISRSFSGKSELGQPLTGHEHAFYLPLDEDGDGRIDHIVIQSKNPFTSHELEAFDRLYSVWQSNGREDIRFILTSTREIERPTESRVWVSSTPIILNRHYRKGRGDFAEWLRNEIQRECEFHGLPSPQKVELIGYTIHLSSPKYWWKFLRNRKGGKPLAGYGAILEFEEVVRGPFALGSLCHYGLGTFIPTNITEHH